MGVRIVQGKIYERYFEKSYTGPHLYWGNNSHLIFVIFPWAQVLAHFFSTQKRVNRDRTDFAEKNSVNCKQQILQQNSENATHSVQKITHMTFPISPSVMWRNLNFLHMVDEEKFQISPRDRYGEI